MTSRHAGWWRLAAAAWVLNAMLSFESMRSSVWPQVGMKLSIEFVLALLALACWTAWRGPPTVRGLRLLAATTALCVVANGLDVTATLVFGRTVSLYWDGRHLLDVLKMGELAAWQLALGAALLLAVPAAACALSLACWRAVAVGLANVPRKALGATALAGMAFTLAATTLAGTGHVDMRAYAARPVVPLVARQVDVVVGHLVPGAVDLQLPPGPDFKQYTLAGLGKVDVMVVFAESYGVCTLDDAQQSAALARRRAQLARDIAAGGMQVVSTRVRSPTFGGGSWLAHAALLGGVDTRDPAAYELLLASTRGTLVGHFKSNGWRTVNWAPGLQRPWPEGQFYGFDRYADAQRIGYRGPDFGYWRIPDQASMALLHAQELAQPIAQRQPRFIVFPTLASHAPFRPIAPFVDDWQRLTGPDAYSAADVTQALSQSSAWSQAVPNYLASLDYTFEWLGSYLRREAPRGLVTIVIGDHQPWATVSGAGASWDVPVHIVSADAALLSRFVAMGFERGLTPQRPGTLAMHELTPRLLAAFDLPAH